MDAKLLTESGLKAILSKHKIKDNGLQHALAAYDKLDDDAHDDCLKTIAQIGKLAAALRKAREVAAAKEVADYLDDLMDAANSEEKDVAKAKADAGKTDAAEQKKKEKEEKKKDDEDEDEDDEGEEEGEYAERLLTAFKKLKSMNGEPMKFIVCEARPYCGLMVARRISSKHREELTELTGGSNRFHQIGECRFEDGKYIFSSEQTMPGLAKRLQNAVKNFTGKKFKIAHGEETVEEDDESPELQESEQPARSTASASSPEAGAPSKPESPMLAKAPDEWHAMRQDIEKRLGQLQATVLKELADEGPEFAAQITQNMKRFDEILDTLDHRLAESLGKAHAAQSPAARQTELLNAKTILASYIRFVKTEEPLLAHIDSNPFGVEMNLKQTLTDKLTHMAQAIA